MTIEKAREAKDMLKKAFKNVPEIIGVGIAQLSDGAYYVKVNLSHQTDEKLPTYYNTVPIKYEVTGNVHALPSLPKRIAK